MLPGHFFLILLCLFIGYFCGCFTTGYFVGKANHVDIQHEGSGNSGATNALRTMGVKAAVLTLLGDAMKAAIPILIIRLGFPDLEPCWQLYALYMGLGVVLGHNYPVFLHFKGGKGIAAMGGTVLATADWRVTIAAIFIFIGVVAITRYVSLGSLVAAWALPMNIILFYKSSSVFWHMLVVSLMFTFLAYVRHWENIKRLLSGTERKIGEKA
jgi:glycerol-3-phosphate acyltransferase PlsY